ncbi:CU044_5270 family protein [Sphaerisporangium perillae]|uniref:CU044_5270 family protein n=1 Tax=Sphaerisporangium perillae TaxID=2935860 RepID=UPI00200BFDE6|nr:CU044_5270 family protein [Sphaerisporangium perillae]
MDDEIQPFADGRPAAPPYPAEAREAARDRLLAEAAGRRRTRFRFGSGSGRPGGRFGVPRLGWQAAGAFGVTVAVVGGVVLALPSRPAPVAVPGAIATASPQATAADSVAVAPPVDGAELHPRAGQFLLVESETMYTAETMGKTERARYLYRTKRQIWQAADGNAGGLLRIEGLPPKQIPGWPLPQEAQQWESGEWHEISGHCPGQSDDFRTDYVHLSTLPADEAGMREHLYTGSPTKNPADDAAFTAVGDLVRENYLPRAQRQALFEAAKTIPGVEVAERVKDSAGREGIALGRNERGTLTQLIFDPETYMFLGERGTVVDAKAAEAPAGTVLALTAQLKVSVVDELPKVSGAGKDGSCDMRQQEPTPPPDSPDQNGDGALPTPTPTRTRTPQSTDGDTGRPTAPPPRPEPLTNGDAGVTTWAVPSD